MAIKAKGLVKKFGDFTAVNGVDFDVQRGEIFGFLGPNGSGKTTTIRMLLGLIEPTFGEAEILGLPVADHIAEIRPRIGYMSQRFRSASPKPWQCQDWRDGKRPQPKTSPAAGASGWL
jgi:ABC-type multidrug transport system ATPase subunit